MTPTVRSVKDLKDEEAEMKFVKIFRELMRLREHPGVLFRVQRRRLVATCPSLRRLP